MGIFRTPKAPDPYATAAAQGAANKEAAQAQQRLNMVDQYGPDGSSTVYSPTGDVVDGIQRYRVNQTLNPTQLASLQSEQAADLKTNTLANNQLDQLTGHLSNPFKLDEAAIKARTDKMNNPRLAERFARDEAALRTQLINRGMREGTQGFNDAMLSFNQGKNDATTQADLAARTQAINEEQLQYDKPINTIGALLGTGQVQSQQLTPTPQASIDAAPIASLISQNYQNRLSGHNAMLGGLFGLGGQIAGAGTKYALGKWG